MMLEDAGVAYEDVVLDYTQIVVSTGPKLDSGFSSNFAPPLVQKINEIGEVVFQISQLSAVLEYLAEDLGVFLPADIQQRGYARQVANDLADFGSDGFAPFHAKNKHAGYTEQKDEPEVIQAIAEYQAEGTGRLRKWLGHFESFLAAAERRGTGGQPYFASGEEPTYVDFYAYQFFLGYNTSYSNCLEKYPRINALMRALEQRPRLQAYLASDRRWELTGNSCC